MWTVVVVDVHFMLVKAGKDTVRQAVHISKKYLLSIHKASLNSIKNLGI